MRLVIAVLAVTFAIGTSWTLPARADPLPTGLFLSDAPADVKDITQTKPTAKVSDQIVIRGKIGGSKDPFIKDRAVFTLVDLSLKSCDQNPEDKCKYPWDYCCEPKNLIAERSATIQVVDASGKPIKAGLNGIGSLAPGKHVTVVGKVSQTDSKKVLVVSATAIYVGETSANAAIQPPTASTATTPVPRTDQWWTDRHQSFNTIAGRGSAEVVFLGDSITQGWESEGKDAWNAAFAKSFANPANFGIGGDRTQHILWRLDNGNWKFPEGKRPRLVVLMIGTNNSNGSDNTAEEIADGITTIVRKIRASTPDTKVLLLAVFPRGEKPNAQREKNAKASEIASKVADGKSVHYLDIGPKFLSPDGSISKEIMPDFLHLSAKGYQIWADAIEERIKALLAK